MPQYFLQAGEGVPNALKIQIESGGCIFLKLTNKLYAKSKILKF